MVAISLAISTVGLLGMNTLVQSGRAKGAAAVAVGMMLLFCSTFTAVMMQGLLTLPMLVLLQFPHRGRQLFAAGSVLAILVAYAIPLKWSLKEADQRRRLREEYPLIPIEDRIAEPDSSLRFPAETVSMKLLEAEIEEVGWRHSALRNLHEDSVFQFVHSPGFGVGRGMPRGHHRIRIEDPAEAIPQPDASQRSEGEPGESLASRSSESLLLQLHVKGVVDFVNPRGFGYARNRREVAGFQSHRFSAVPSLKGEWTVNAVELISVLVHATPQVYLSENLPRMEDLSKTKTRPLDAFERESLPSLKIGEDLAVRTVSTGTRMLGAIRNTTHCTTCHGGTRGDLLGAFSYQLQRVGQ